MPEPNPVLPVLRAAIPVSSEGPAPGPGVVDVLVVTVATCEGIGTDAIS